MPAKIPFSRELLYLRALADTGNATLAAARARVSRDWAYKRRFGDPRFDAWCQAMIEQFRAGPPHRPAADAAPPHPTLSLQGRGLRRVQVRRDRVGGWSAAKEAQFIERLLETCSVWLASAEVGLSTVSAYRRRQVRPAFAAAWDEAERLGWPPAIEP